MNDLGRVLSVGGKAPQIADGAFVAPGAAVVGDVHVGARSGVWYSSVVRADVAPIRIGEETNIQDGSILHADPEFPLTVGDRVTVGHRVVLHGATVEDEVLIGMGSVAMNGAVIGPGSVVGAGAVIKQGTQDPSRLPGTRGTSTGRAGTQGRRTRDGRLRSSQVRGARRAPSGRGSGVVVAPPAQVQPHLPRPEPTDQLLPRPLGLYQGNQFGVADLLFRRLPRNGVVEGGRGDLDPVLREHATDRLDPELLTAGEAVAANFGAPPAQPHKVDQSALAIATDISAHPRHALTRIKELLVQGRMSDAATARQNESRLFQELRSIATPGRG